MNLCMPSSFWDGLPYRINADATTPQGLGLNTVHGAHCHQGAWGYSMASFGVSSQYFGISCTVFSKYARIRANQGADTSSPYSYA